MKKIIDVSLIIPLKNDYNIFKELYFYILDQEVLPKELIIVDTTIGGNIEKLKNLKELNNEINIKYINKINCYPGKARNVGVQYSVSNYLAFLDVKTFPPKNWLANYYKLLINSKKKVIFG